MVYSFLRQPQKDSPVPQTASYELPHSIFPEHSRRYLTGDADILRYRREMFAELEQNPVLIGALLHFTEIFTDISDYPTSRSIIVSLLRQKERMRELAALHEVLLREFPNSEALCSFAEFIGTIMKSAKYRKIVQDFEKIPDRLENIRSVTLGINLDGNYNASEAGLISINEDYFSSASPIEQFLRMSRQNPAEPLLKITPSDDAEKMAKLNLELMNTINRVIRRELKGRDVHTDTILRYNFGLSYSLVEEIQFAAEAAQRIREMREYGAAFVYTETLDGTDIGDFLTCYRKMRLGYEINLYEREEIREDIGKTAVYMLELGLPVMLK
ncbi:MAG: hypothetical protein IJ334_08335 [Clostridia bacterium]|nr:hypothetical protein [Clostridia bacterium]